MLKQGFIATAIALGTLGALGTAPASAAVSVQLQIAPPAPRAEYVPAPRRGHVWAPGHWDWRGQRHVWVGERTPWLPLRRTALGSDGQVLATAAWGLATGGQPPR